jgi:hypothetical protein
MSQIAPSTQPGPALKPHRGTLVLVLGILGLVLCVICGIVAWVLGNSDLREMDAGMMDPSGRGMTQAGRILGMVSVGLAVLGLIIWIPLMLIGAMSGR